MYSSSAVCTPGAEDFATVLESDRLDSVPDNFVERFLGFSMPGGMLGFRRKLLSAALSSARRPRFPSRQLSSASKSGSTFPPLPQPSDPPQQWLQLSGGRRVSITDEGSGEMGCATRSRPLRPKFPPVHPSACRDISDSFAHLFLVVGGARSTVVALHGTPGTVYDFRYLGGELVTTPSQPPAPERVSVRARSTLSRRASPLPSSHILLAPRALRLRLCASSTPNAGACWVQGDTRRPSRKRADTPRCHWPARGPCRRPGEGARRSQKDPGGGRVNLNQPWEKGRTDHKWMHESVCGCRPRSERMVVLLLACGSRKKCTPAE